MVKITNRKGDVVNVEIQGIAELKRNIEAKTEKIVIGEDLAILRVANFLQSEIKESIVGNRAEQKSVDSGLFANSIAVQKNDTSKYTIYVQKQKYPNSDTTTQDISKYMEYGTSRIEPRRHFRNTLARNKKKVIDEIKKVIKEKSKLK